MRHTGGQSGTAAALADITQATQAAAAAADGAASLPSSAAASPAGQPAAAAAGEQTAASGSPSAVGNTAAEKAAPEEAAAAPHGSSKAALPPAAAAGAAGEPANGGRALPPCLVNSLLQPGDVSWSAANGSVDQLSIRGCPLRRFSHAEAVQCLAGKRLVFVGDSITR